MAQATTTVNPLNDFLGSVNSAAADINAQNAKETPASPPAPTSATPAAATSASPSAAAGHSGVSRTTLIVAVVCGIIGALIIGLLIGLCCWCLARRRRRQRRNSTQQPADEEVKTWRSHEPKQPGRDYSPHRNSHLVMEQQPMIPPAAKAPDMQQQHPAHRNNNAENPFVPVPPSPRRQAPNSRAGLTDGTVPGAAPYVLPAESQRLYKPRSRSGSRPRTASNPALPMTNTTSRPSTPFGLSGIGQPYEDMHVHVLQTDHPSHELRQSLPQRDPILSPPSEPIHRYDTPPMGTISHNPLAQQPNRSSTASASNNYNNNLNNNTGATNSTADTSSTEGSTSADDWRYNKATTTFAGIPPWEQRQHRYSNSPSGSAHHHTDIPAAPPIPWSDREARNQSPSHSPRQSRDGISGGGGVTPTNGGYVEGARRNSRSPATSINGQPRRLRFSDLTAEDVGNGGAYRHSQGVGEAL
ncbi:MAG: hypothetical protein Q9178_004082 [Gyalolechia marmorata]